jgi:hypothetical protein
MAKGAGQAAVQAGACGLVVAVENFIHHGDHPSVEARFQRASG